MPATPTPNADLEQSLFRANLKEARLRHRAFLAFLLPAILGAVWLIYSIVVVTQWEAESDAVAKKEAELVTRETQWKQAVVDAEKRRDTAENSVTAAQDKQRVAEERAADIEKRLVQVREEVGALGSLLHEVSAVKLKASKLGSSEPVETHLTEIRKSLGGTLGRIEQEIDKGLPTTAQKSRVYVMITDETQRTLAKNLTPILEKAGFDVVAVLKSAIKRGDNTEVRYFREPADRDEATRLQEIVQKELNLTDARIARTVDSDQATGSRKLQLWLGKPSDVAAGPTARP